MDGKETESSGGGMDMSSVMALLGNKNSSQPQRVSPSMSADALANPYNQNQRLSDVPESAVIRRGYGISPTMSPEYKRYNGISR
jgi:hypothetical protein